MSRNAWCPECNTVDHTDAQWRCLWCGTTTLATLKPTEGRESRTLTTAQLAEAHDRYARGENLTTLSRAYYTGRDTLKQNFWHAGLPTRSMAVSNALEAPRRRVHKAHKDHNPAYRRDLTDAAIKRAYDTLGSLQAAALNLNCSVSTVHRRLSLAGHPRNAPGRNQHTKRRP